MLPGVEGVGVPVAVTVDVGVGVGVPAGVLLVVYPEPFADRVTHSAWTYVLLPVPPRPVEHATTNSLVPPLLTFVPSVYLYPSQPGRLNAVSNALGVVWACLLIAILFRLPADSYPQAEDTAVTRWLALASLAYPAFYLAASWTITLRRWRGIAHDSGS